MDLSDASKRDSEATKSTNSESHQLSKLLFQLPNEILDKIILHDLALQHDDSIPSILIVLGSLEDKTWYNWGRTQYRAINACITWRNEDAFNKQKMPELLKIRHVKIVSLVYFKAQKMSLRNNLETITIDMTKAGLPDDYRSPRDAEFYRRGEHHASAATLISLLVGASTAIHKIIVKLRRDQDCKSMPFIDSGLRFKPRQEMVLQEDAQLLIWESTNLLRWKGI